MNSSIDDTRRFLSLVARPGEVFELRALSRFRGQQHVDTGYFDDFEQLVRAAAAKSGEADGVYVTINPVNPALLARAPKNRVRRAGTGDTTSDRDVARRRSLLIDVDPVRPTGISSNDDEHRAALELAKRIRDELDWPNPILADSGNGAHLIYAVDLPVDDGGLIGRVLTKLSQRYSSASLKVDEKVFNPARISKIYGTLTRKGENTPERPHRIARIIEAPERLVEIAREALEAFAPAPQKRTATTFTAESSTFKIDEFIAKYLPDAKERSWASGCRKWILPVCPFNDSHDRGEAHIEEFDSGALSAGCLHESCKWTWKDLRQKFEPREPRTNGHANGHSNGHAHKLTDRELPREVLYEDDRDAGEIARTEAEYDRIADEDRDASSDIQPPRKPLWHRCPSLVDAIMERANDPWITLTLGTDEIVRLRAGATAVLIGGSGSGKSSLTSCLVVNHARHTGPAIVLSIELPAEELAARIVGIKNDASWEDALRGRVRREDMERALDLPRMFVLDRRRATIKNLETCIDAVRQEYPDQPILVAVDYAQLLDSKEREIRMRVADAFSQLDEVAREKKVVVLALSQMSRVNAQRARSGEMLGAESASAGAEASAIERFATVTLTIGMAAEREDGSSAVEVSVGKARMSKGDRVIPMTYWGRSGLWQVAGEAKSATEVRDSREAEKESKARSTAELAMLGAARIAKEPLVTRAQLMEGIAGRKATKVAALTSLLARGDLVEVNKKQPKTKHCFLAVPDRARDAGIPLRQINLIGVD